jgi:hypothetical protein
MSAIFPPQSWLVVHQITLDSILNILDVIILHLINVMLWGSGFIYSFTMTDAPFVLEIIWFG